MLQEQLELCTYKCVNFAFRQQLVVARARQNEIEDLGR